MRNEADLGWALDDLDDDAGHLGHALGGEGASSIVKGGNEDELIVAFTKARHHRTGWRAWLGTREGRLEPSLTASSSQTAVLRPV